MIAHDQNITLSEWMVTGGLVLVAAVGGLLLAWLIERIWPLYPRD